MRRLRRRWMKREFFGILLPSELILCSDTASVTSDPMTVFVTVTPTDTVTVTIVSAAVYRSRYSRADCELSLQTPDPDIQTDFRVSLTGHRLVRNVEG
jgi:hypothetical protein